MSWKRWVREIEIEPSLYAADFLALVQSLVLPLLLGLPFFGVGLLLPQRVQFALGLAQFLARPGRFLSGGFQRRLCVRGREPATCSSAVVQSDACRSAGFVLRAGVGFLTLDVVHFF